MHNYIRYFAGASLLALMIGLAVFNVAQWLTEGFYILAVVALCSELIGFVMAVMIEVALRQRPRRAYLKAAVCFVVLAACAGFNVIGAERAWDASMVRHLEAARNEAQRAIDDTRAELQAKLAQANAQIASHNDLLPGPTTVRARQAGMQAAWNAATAQARADAAKAQHDLDAAPIVATVTAPFTDWQVRLGFGLAELTKALGLWACGFGALIVAAAAQESVSETERSPRERKETLETPAETDEVVVSFPGETLREKVVAMRKANPPVSYGRIHKEYGVPKATAWKWVNAAA